MNENEHENEYTQLTPGQKFHHKGGNGVEYFKLTVVAQGDGSIYPMTETAPACNIVPIECDAEGNVIALYLMKQDRTHSMQPLLTYLSLTIRKILQRA